MANELSMNDLVNAVREGIYVDESGHTGILSSAELQQKRRAKIEARTETQNVPVRNYAELKGNTLFRPKKQEPVKAHRLPVESLAEKQRRLIDEAEARREVASRSLASQFEEFKAQEAAAKAADSEIGGRYAYDKQAVDEYRATDVRFGNSRLKNYVSNLDAKAEVETLKAKSEYDAVVAALKDSLENNDEAAIKARDEAKKVFDKAVSDSAANTRADLYRYLDIRTGFSSQREAWQKLVDDAGWTGLTSRQKDNLLQNNSELMSLQKQGYLNAKGLNLEKARSDSYEAFLGSEQGKSLMQELKTVERLGDSRIYGSAGVAENEILSLLNKKAPSQSVKETLGESLKSARFGSVGKMAIGALMTVGLVSALSDSRGSQTSAQLYGQAPLY